MFMGLGTPFAAAAAGILEADDEGVACDAGCCGGGDEGVPLGGSRSMSIELRLLMLFADMAEKRFRCSGGRFRGCVSGSIFFRREPGSVGCLAKERDGRALASRSEGDSGRGAGLCDEDDAAEDLGGALAGGLVGDLTGEEGSDCELYSSSSAFLADLEKNFIGPVVPERRTPWTSSGKLAWCGSSAQSACVCACWKGKGEPDLQRSAAAARFLLSSRLRLYPWMPGAA